MEDTYEASENSDKNLFIIESVENHPYLYNKKKR